MGAGEVTEQLLTRLDEADLEEEVADLVLAAALGPGELADAIGGERPTRPAAADADQVEPSRTYLSQITVSGFRGIGPTATLALPPGPGVTLVVGRNGSGKSTFAEAAELALSGETSRWQGKSSVLWKAGWANAHHEGDRRIAVRLHRDGIEGQTSVERRWGSDAGLDDGVGVAQEPGGPEMPLAELGLDADLDLRRPFLSYDELGGLWSETPSARHDRLNVLLGLEDWGQVQKRLQQAAKDIGSARKEADKQAKALVGQIAPLDDPRAEAVVAALTTKGGWKLEVVEAHVAGDTEEDPSLVGLRSLANLTTLPVEAVEAAVARLRAAADGVDAVAGGSGERASELADLLQAALDHHEHADSSDCPVCGAGERLGADWVAATSGRIAELRAEAKDHRDARREADAALAAARELVRPVPTPLQDGSPEVTAIVTSLSAAADLWTSWASPPEGLRELADHLEGRVAGLADAIERVRVESRSEVDRRQDEWRPLAESLAGWLPGARSALAERPLEARLKAAAKWVGEQAKEVRAERFSPIAERVRAVWDQLRLDSNVSVDDLSLDGAATHRRLEVSVSVDDAASEAGVALLSQGELHALSLALFLPRATHPESPFRFVLIDDPVQAMDGSRVDGLARVLASVGEDRQVVVFTHDERLPDAFRSLGLEARVLEVRRMPGSQVSVRQMLGPAERYLDDARAIVRTDGYPESARDRVVPGLCRRAVEATAVDLGRRRLLAEGRPFDEVEASVVELKKLRSHIAFALFGDAGRHGEVDDRLRSLLDGAAVGTMIQLNKGSHDGINADAMVAGAQRLVEDLNRHLS